MDDIFDKMRVAVLDGEEDVSVELAKQALSEGVDLNDVMNKGFLKGIQEAGRLYEDGEYFLPDLVCSAEAMKAAMAVLDEELKSPTSGVESKGKVVTATVQGDVHDIGITIVGAMFTANGYEVIHLGADVLNEEVLKNVKELNPDILGLSALLTTTMEEQRTIIEALKEAGIREDTKVIVGGAPVTHDWSEIITADGYSDDALGAVELVARLL